MAFINGLVPSPSPPPFFTSFPPPRDERGRGPGAVQRVCVYHTHITFLFSLVQGYVLLYYVIDVQLLPQNCAVTVFCTVDTIFISLNITSVPPDELVKQRVRWPKFYRTKILNHMG